MRLMVASLLIGVVGALIGVAPASAATARPAGATPNSCVSGCGPCPQGVTWHVKVWPFIGAIYTGFVYSVNSATPTFLASDARQVSNGLSTPITVTLTSQVSQTYQITTTTGYANELTDTLTVNVSTAIVASRTTAIGVNVQATVPPLSSILGEYGLHGYNVNYDVTPYISTGQDFPRNVCSRQDTQRGLTATAPTHVEGWRITQL